MNPAITFEPDGYVLDGPRLMGRQSAGNGFLRAAVAAHAGAPIRGYSPLRQTGEAFRKLVLSLDPTATPQWVPGHRVDLLAELRVLYRPDQVLGPAARFRLRAGPARYSLCGVTHTLSTGSTLEAIADIHTAPLGPWDALICTSRAAIDVVKGVLTAQADYLAWRLGQPAAARLPQLPLIPLGVHCDDFASSDAMKAEARLALGIAGDEVVALFAGRLSVSGKAHPYAMYAALQAVAKRTGKRMVILHAGQFFNVAIERAFHEAAAEFCPGVRASFIDGADTGLYRMAWRAADLFVSLSDSIQETFGLTPVEAMAAGLPVLVSDWNGYRDTVRDGVDGFCIPTWAPTSGGGALSASYESLGHAAAGYDNYLSQASTAVAIDHGSAVERLTALVNDEGLRREMGESGRRRARAVFDWSVIYRQYQALWTELDARRIEAEQTDQAWLLAAPKAQAAARGPFETFATYPTNSVGPTTLVQRVPGADVARFRALTAQLLLSLWNPPAVLVERVLEALDGPPKSLRALAEDLRLPEEDLAETVARLAKLGLLNFPQD